MIGYRPATDCSETRLAETGRYAHRTFTAEHDLGLYESKVVTHSTLPRSRNGVRLWGLRLDRVRTRVLSRSTKRQPPPRYSGVHHDPSRQVAPARSLVLLVAGLAVQRHHALQLTKRQFGEEHASGTDRTADARVMLSRHEHRSHHRDADRVLEKSDQDVHRDGEYDGDNQ